MASSNVIKQRNKILGQIANAKRNNPAGGAAPPGEDLRTSADNCSIEDCWHWVQCGDSACDKCNK